MVSFATPWALLLLVLLPATALAGRARLRRLPGRRGLVALAARLAVLALLVAALAGPAWRTVESRVAVMFLVDASASMGPAGQRAGMAWAARAVTAGGPHDQAGMVLFGAVPQLAVPLAHYRTLPDPAAPANSATDVESALRLGLSLLPPGAPGRLVLLSDGQQTTGDAADAVSSALLRGVPIDTVALAPPPRRDVLVRAFTAPRLIRVGDEAPLEITLRSTVATSATLTLSIDGQTAQQAVSLAAGDTVLRATPRLATPGLHTFWARVDAPGDRIPQNNILDASTVVAPPGHVLLAVNDPSTARGLATTLARAHLSVRPVLASALPTSAAAFHSYDEVVLDDVPATGLRQSQQRALRDAVSADGLGLLALGGPNSFGQGGYAHSTLEDALPVLSTSTPRRASAPIALMLVIDKSGSMDDQVDGVAKVDMVKVAATSALDRLNSGDAVGVLAFDDTNHWIVPFHILQGDADKAHIRHQIAGLGADGDTYIYPALQDAERALLRVPTVYRHVVLLTDGQGEDANFDALIRRMRHEHITLSTIGVGQDVVQDELNHWARLGGGQYHYVSDPHAIPRIVVNEARYGATGSAEVRGHIRLGVAAASPLLRSLAAAGQALPTIGSYDSTAPKSNAQVSVQAASGDPVLSSWQYGLGRVVAWTSDAGAAWADGWAPTRLPTFWSDLVRWAMRGYTPRTGVPDLGVSDGQLRVSLALRQATGAFDDAAAPRVRLSSPDGSVQALSLPLAAPGLYAANVPLRGPGIYAATPVRNDRGASAPSDVAALAVPYPGEYADNGVDTAFLSHLAAASGGHTLTRPADALSHAGVPLTTTWEPLWPWLLALALLLFPVDVGLRLLLPPDPMYRARPAP